MFIEYIIFGIIDNVVMIIGAFTGLSFERYLPKRFQKGLGIVIGAGIGNAFSDFLGGAVSLNWGLAFGTALGCLLALIIIPVFSYYKGNNKWK